MNKIWLVLSLALIPHLNPQVRAGGFVSKYGPQQVGSFQKTPEYIPPITEEKSDEILAADGAGTKPLVQIKRGDLELTLGGVTKVESFFARNVVLLNDSIPGEYGYWKQTFDFTADLKYGEEKFGHEAVQAFINIRQKNMWGNTGKFTSAASESVKLDGTDVTIGDHSHKIAVPVLWLKDAWVRASLNAIFDKPDSPLHFVKAGFFPFWVGRGIAYGPIYGSKKDFLGIYSGYQNDQSAPAVNLHGILMKDRLSYDLYYAKIEEKSSSLGETFNFVKANHFGRSQTPFRGVNKDNDLFLMRINWNALKKGDRRGYLNLEPYVLFNEASDRQIEFEADAKSELGIAGIASEYKYKNFEWGFDTAFNFGQTHVRNIDRNNITLARETTTGNIREEYSKINVSSATGDSVNVTNDVKTLVEASKNTANGQFIGNVSGIGDLYNASDRFRPAFQNKYGGWMFVTDASYTLEPISARISATYGFASGDVNPNTEEVDKTYHGFVGLQEAYSGKRVPSVLVLDARKIRRPVLIDENTREALDDESFTDMHIFGFGATWYPIENREDKFYLQSNTLFFWKDKTTAAFDSQAQTAASFDADNFLGIEWNVRIKRETLKDLYIFGDFAVFVPGGFYNDVKGTPLSGDVFNKLDETDQTGVDQNNFRLGDDTAFLINAGISYKF